MSRPGGAVRWRVLEFYSRLIKECIMNRSAIPKLPKRVLALVLAAALLTPSAFASAGTAQINTAQTLADGLVYRNTVSNHSSAGRMESFAL